MAKRDAERRKRWRAAFGDNRMAKSRSVMRKNLLLILPAVLAAACGGGERRSEAVADHAATASQRAAFADLVIHGGPIHTGVDAAPTVEAVAVRAGAISGVGAYAGLEEAIGTKTRVIDLDGAAMFPGFTDAHAHLVGIGMRELTLNLEGTPSLAALVAAVASALEDAAAGYVQETTRGPVLYGRGWIETGWPEGRMPTREDLDAVSGEAIVILERADGHAVVANSAALDAAGVETETPDPEGGRIERDAEGRATGLLIDNASGLVMEFVAAPDEARLNEAYAKGGEVYAAYGWTGLHNMSVDPDHVSLMETLSETGALPLRVYNAVDRSGLDALASEGPRAGDNGKIITRTMKLYVDGALGSRGAALSAPYADAPETDGLLLMQADEAKALYAKAFDAGVQVATHAIGDRGNTLVLDWYAEALAGAPDGADPRWRIEHAQILHTSDIPRFAELGVVASMQPSHAIGDLHFAPDRLGPDRLDGAYAWRSLIDAGAIIAGGSDAPVERGDPLIEFYAAVARADLEGFQGEDWRPEEAVTRAEALKMFTSWPAYAAFQEDKLGSIEIGKRADFSVFSADIMTVPAEEIPAAKALMTIVDGEVVYEAAR